ncbi:hypothetical protein BASA50_006836 [Batrachochytrium salamandrivorans]|uniref:26S proteasome complex subunit SEM1 n=1 Tax=Batrachochytrium salamandrivorans TaxID=1357716 RepID=A0ABQ8F944_9FUNG|nr:hypothetical protein BASA62_008081 [Batrachochytrium salamandrivorans]KAH6572793.1 hypothetical protein BASA60_006468 [Batrachochytrium salamandrivorans]KAH6594139.1 hypothetical protein BASA50_006836 [Batrachochytrium salamandrivorans]KAH6601699.1 hypothetical protein BASA61_001903 [Batrachochytrium salamandrivorans]KAH9273075.1 hypothetical protein BASA83_004652 [Batrachochytrium salamandrivorans]
MPAPAETTSVTGKGAKGKTAPAAEAKPVKPEVALEDDDDFEDFPAEPCASTVEESDNLHQWEDTWEDDDDEMENFAVQLK